MPNNGSFFFLFEFKYSFYEMPHDSSWLEGIFKVPLLD
jgi:hypothetical protein